MDRKYDAVELARLDAAAEAVGRHYERVIQNCDPATGYPSASVPWIDQVVYLLMVIRCDMDQDGFPTLFEERLNRDELQFIIGAFQQLDEPELAAEFQHALDAITNAHFELARDGRLIDPPLLDQIYAIEKRVREIGRLWLIDEKLVNLLPLDRFGSREKHDQ